MAEKIISRKVVSEKVIGRANPFMKKLRNLKGSLKGIIAAPILALAAFGLLIYSENFTKNSEIVSSLVLQSPSEAVSSSGMVKVQDTPTIKEPVDLQWIDKELDEAVYYNYKIQEFKEVEKTESDTRTVVKDGKEVEETVETTKLVEEWVDEETKSSWARFTLGDIEVKPQGAKLKADYQNKTYKMVSWDGVMGEEVELKDITSGVSSSDEIGDRRLKLSYIPADEKLLVIGEINNKTIKGGDPFMISTKSDEELVKNLESGESFLYWGIKVLTWFLFTGAFMAILGPILSVLDFIPFAGKTASCVATIVGGIVSLGIVVMASIIIKYWYVCIGLLCLGFVGLIVLLVMLLSKKENKKK